MSEDIDGINIGTIDELVEYIFESGLVSMDKLNLDLNASADDGDSSSSIISNDDFPAWRKRMESIENSMYSKRSTCDGKDGADDDVGDGVMEKLKQYGCGNLVAKLEAETLNYFDCVKILDELIARDSLGRTILMKYKCPLIQKWIRIKAAYEVDNMHIVDSAFRLEDSVRDLNCKNQKICSIQGHIIHLRSLRSKLFRKLRVGREKEKDSSTYISQDLFLKDKIADIDRALEKCELEKNVITSSVESRLPDDIQELSLSLAKEMSHLVDTHINLSLCCAVKIQSK